MGGGGLSAEGVLVEGGRGYKMVAKVDTRQNGHPRELGGTQDGSQDGSLAKMATI